MRSVSLVIHGHASKRLVSVVEAHFCCTGFKWLVYVIATQCTTTLFDACGHLNGVSHGFPMALALINCGKPEI